MNKSSYILFFAILTNFTCGQVDTSKSALPKIPKLTRMVEHVDRIWATAGQQDTILILQGTDWQTVGDWFGSNKVTLKPLEKLPDPDSIGLSPQKEVRRIEIWCEKMYRERINSDQTGKLKYTFQLYCSVGETLYEVKTFNLEKSVI